MGAILGCALWLMTPAALADAADAHYQLAKTLRAEGRYEEALAEIDLAVATRPSYAQGHLTRGSILRRLGRYQEALRAFERAIALEPKDGRAYGLAGAALLRLDRPKEAVKYLSKATELEPKHSNHWLNLGVAYRKADNNDAAIATYQRALKVIPNDPLLLNNLGVALRKAQRYEEAIKTLEHALTLDPYDLEVSRNLAIAFRGAKRYKEAIPIYIKALELGDGGPPDLLFDLASCYEKSARPIRRLLLSSATSKPPRRATPRQLSAPGTRSRTSSVDSVVETSVDEEAEARLDAPGLIRGPGRHLEVPRPTATYLEAHPGEEAVADPCEGADRAGAVDVCWQRDADIAPGEGAGESEALDVPAERDHAPATKSRIVERP